MGTASAPVSFSPVSGMSGGWTGFYIGSRISSSEIQYTRILNASIGLDLYKDMGTSIHHLVIKGCSKYGVYLHYDHTNWPAQDTCTIEDNAVNIAP